MFLYKYIIIKPKLLVCLHPFTQLDDLTKRALYPQFLSLANNGAGIVLFTSNTSEIVTLCDRIMIIHKDRTPVIYSNSEFSALDIENLY